MYLLRNVGAKYFEAKDYELFGKVIELYDSAEDYDVKDRTVSALVNLGIDSQQAMEWFISSERGLT